MKTGSEDGKNNWAFHLVINLKNIGTSARSGTFPEAQNGKATGLYIFPRA